MHCNHRSPRHPGACKYCWRFGIVIWSLVYGGALVLLTIETKNPGLICLVLPGVLIGHSIGGRWEKGDPQ